jgi:TatD DNase family protein
MFADAHCHLFDYAEACWRAGMTFELPRGLYCASAHDPAEFAWQEKLAGQRPGEIVLSFGIHPQRPLRDVRGFLGELARSGRIGAIGEAGFDLFPEYRQNLAAQTAAFEAQLELAAECGLPLVIHARRSLNLIFAYARRLKTLPAVIFHAWPGSPEEARAFLARGISAYFSLGTQILNGNKRASRSVAEIELGRLLLETDAPYQALRGQSLTKPEAIAAVAAEAARLRGIPEPELVSSMERNFLTAFGGVEKPGGGRPPRTLERGGGSGNAC